MTDSSVGRRGLVLGGGGIAGIAWESALLATLLEGGVDLYAADVVVGTSAGSVVGTALRAGGLEHWYPAQLQQLASGSDAGSEAAAYDAVVPEGVEAVMAAFAAASASTSEPQQARAELGAFAAGARLARTEAASRARMAQLVPAGGWPHGDLRITVVDAEDGAFRVLDSASGVELVSAVAASCAVPGIFPTITIDGRRYMDGGMRSATNADVAADCDRVLVLSCGPEPAASALGPSLPQVVAELRGSTEVLVVEADAATLAAFGTNSLSPEVGPAAAEAGARQGAAALAAVRDFWS